MATKAKLPYRPRWEGPIHGHSVNVIRKFFPKLCAEHEFDDLLQEAYIVFMKCKQNFRQAEGSRPAPHFMGYYSRALRNRLINLAQKCGRTLYMENAPEQVTDRDDALLKVVFNELPASVRGMLMHVQRGTDARAAFSLKRLQELFIPSTQE